MNAIFLSDVHLIDGTSLKTQLMIRFFQEVASRFERIYILGDLFDVWPGTTSHLIRVFRPVLKTLERLVEDGHSIHYLEGNHDFRLGKYFRENLGIQVHTETIIEEWDGKKVFMTHGDLGNPKEIGYRALRYVLRHNLLHLGLRAVPPEWIYKAGLKTSSASRGYQKQLPVNESAIRQIYRNTAEKIFREGYDVVLMGHTHLPDDVCTLVEGRKCRYINTGDWVRHFSYLEYDGSEFYTKIHPLKDL